MPKPGGSVLFRQPLHGLDGRAEAAAGRGVALDLGGREHVVVHDAIGAAAPLDVEHRAERHHLARPRCASSAADVFRIGADSPFGLGAHLEGAAEAVEVVDVDRAEVHLQGIEDVAQRYVQLVRLDAVDVGIELRRGGAERREDAGDGRVVVRRLDERVGRPLQGMRAARPPWSCTSSLKPPAVPSPCTGGGGNDEDLRPR